MSRRRVINTELMLEQKSQRDAAELLYDNGYAGILVTAAAASALVFTFEGIQQNPFKLYWWSGLMIFLAFRLADTYFWKASQFGTHYDGQKAVYRFVAGTLITAVIWSVYCVVLQEAMSDIEAMVSIVIISALAGGGGNVLAAHKPTAVLYPAILLFPFSYCLLMSSFEHRYILGFLGFAFGLVMMAAAIKSSRFTEEAIRLKNENAVLLNQMETEVQKRTEKIYELSNKDPLTGLFNRTAFSAHLAEQLQTSKATRQPLALLFIDLDGFKAINDSFGHETGDRILKKTAQRLKFYSPNSQLLCRWGGDEFLVACDNTDTLQARQMAQKLIQEISNPCTLDDNHLLVSATIGIAMYPQHADSERELIQFADIAMYHQKKSSPSGYSVFSAELGEQLRREQVLRDALPEAIKNNQLRLVFQPIVDAHTCQPVAFEALLRWHLDDEAVTPDEFIELAEQYGQIRKIGTWVMNQACINAASWPRERGLKVSVNVSVIQLQDEGFIDMVNAALNLSGLPPNLLHVEITESAFAADKGMLLGRIKELQSLGIEVSIDDFGTEYSSLSIIQELSPDTVKIDRSFVDSLETSGFPIISAVLHISTAFGYRVIAEGVENQAQATKLAALGVHYLQGFYFSRPVEAADVSVYLGSRQQSA